MLLFYDFIAHLIDELYEELLKRLSGFFYECLCHRKGLMLTYTIIVIPAVLNLNRSGLISRKIKKALNYLAVEI